MTSKGRAMFVVAMFLLLCPADRGHDHVVVVGARGLVDHLDAVAALELQPVGDVPVGARARDERRGALPVVLTGGDGVEACFLVGRPSSSKQTGASLLASGRRRKAMLTRPHW